MEMWIPVIVSIVSAIGTIASVVVSGKVNRKKQDDKLGEKLDDLLVLGMRADMFNLLEACRKNGYRTEKSDEIFMGIWTEYIRLKGNHWGEQIKADYYLLPRREYV